MRTFDDFLAEQMQDPEFRAEWERQEPEFAVIRAILDARIAKNLSQKQLSELTGINQADISRIENGNGNPSIRTLQRLAEGLGMKLKLEFVPV